MARRTNGTNQSLQSISSINLSSFAAISVSVWLYWDAFANDNDLAIELTNNFNNFTTGFVFCPNNVGGGGTMFFGHKGNTGSNLGDLIPRFSAAAWHHIVFNLDKSAAGASEVGSFWVDGVAQSVTRGTVNNTNNFGNEVLYLMSRGNASLFGAGAIAEVAIYGGIQLTQTDVNNLYNNGRGRIATEVQSSSLAYYWRLLGINSPEPATVGGVDMQINGATAETHPITVGSNPIQHAYAELTTVQSHTGDNLWADIGVEIPSDKFIVGKKYLIIARVSYRLNTAGGTFNVKVVHGSTDFAESESINRCFQVNDAFSYMWFTVWTAISNEGIKFQFKVNTSTHTIEANTANIFAMNLSDNFTEGVDWIYDVDDIDTGSIATGIDGASVTFTPAVAGQDWLVMSLAQIDVGETIQRPMSYLNVDGSFETDLRKIGWRSGNTSTIHMLSQAYIFQLTAAEHTFLEHSVTAGGTAGDIRLHSAVFAINLNKFKQHVVSSVSLSLNLGTVNYGTNIATVNITPELAGSDIWIGSYCKFNRNATLREGEFRLQIGNVDTPPNQTTPNWQFSHGDIANDENPVFLQTLESLPAISHTLDFDGSVDSTTGTPQADYGSIWAVLLETIPTIIPQFKVINPTLRRVRRRR